MQKKRPSCDTEADEMLRSLHPDWNTALTAIHETWAVDLTTSTRMWAALFPAGWQKYSSGVTSFLSLAANNKRQNKSSLDLSAWQSKNTLAAEFLMWLCQICLEQQFF